MVSSSLSSSRTLGRQEVAENGDVREPGSDALRGHDATDDTARLQRAINLAASPYRRLGSKSGDDASAAFAAAPLRGLRRYEGTKRFPDCAPSVAFSGVLGSSKRPSQGPRGVYRAPAVAFLARPAAPHQCFNNQPTACHMKRCVVHALVQKRAELRRYRKYSHQSQEDDPKAVNLDNLAGAHRRASCSRRNSALQLFHLTVRGGTQATGKQNGPQGRNRTVDIRATGSGVRRPRLFAIGGCCPGRGFEANSETKNSHRTDGKGDPGCSETLSDRTRVSSIFVEHSSSLASESRLPLFRKHSSVTTHPTSTRCVAQQAA